MPAGRRAGQDAREGAPGEAEVPGGVRRRGLQQDARYLQVEVVADLLARPGTFNTTSRRGTLYAIQFTRGACFRKSAVIAACLFCGMCDVYSYYIGVCFFLVFGACHGIHSGVYVLAPSLYSCSKTCWVCRTSVPCCTSVLHGPVPRYQRLLRFSPVPCV